MAQGGKYIRLRKETGLSGEALSSGKAYDFKSLYFPNSGNMVYNTSAILQ